MTALAAQISASRNGLNDAVAARAASKAATTTFRDAMGDLRADAGALIRTIRAYAATTNNPNVYAAAQIDPPAPPTPARAPTQPTDMRAIVEPTGALTLQWKPTRPAPEGSKQDDSTAGVIYTVRRKLRNESNFTIVGAVPAARGGSRAFSSFTDYQLPGNGASDMVQYYIQGQRANTTGLDLVGPESPVYTIMLGAGGGSGQAVVSVVSSDATGQVKLAA